MKDSAYLFHVGFGLGVEAASKVGRVGLEKTWAVPGVLLIVLVDAAGGEDGAVDALQEAAVGQVEGADDIGPHGFLLVVLTPVDVGATGAAGGVEDMGRLDAVELLEDLLAVLHAHSGGMHVFALRLEDVLEMTGDPALAAPDQEPVVCLGTVGAVGAIGAIGAIGAVGRHVEPPISQSKSQKVGCGGGGVLLCKLSGDRRSTT